MPYATLADLIARYGEDELIQLTDRAEPPAGVIDPAPAESALADAGAEADGYIAARHSLPLPQVPPVVTSIVCALARERLYKDRATEAVTAGADRARRQLLDIAQGRLVLGQQADLTAGPADVAVHSGPDRAITRQTMGF